MNVASDIAKSVRDFFPFTLAAYETPHFTRSPYDFRAAYLANRPKGESWYAYDVVVKSPTEVEFIVYDMRCNLSGGIGKEARRFKCTVAPEVTAPSIERRVQAMAVLVRQQELDRIEQAAIGGYADVIRSKLQIMEPA